MAVLGNFWIFRKRVKIHIFGVIGIVYIFIKFFWRTFMQVPRIQESIIINKLLNKYYKPIMKNKKESTAKKIRRILFLQFLIETIYFNRYRLNKKSDSVGLFYKEIKKNFGRKLYLPNMKKQDFIYFTRHNNISHVIRRYKPTEKALIMNNKLLYKLMKSYALNIDSDENFVLDKRNLFPINKDNKILSFSGRNSFKSISGLPIHHTKLPKIIKSILNSNAPLLDKSYNLIKLSKTIFNNEKNFNPINGKFNPTIFLKPLSYKEQNNGRITITVGFQTFGRILKHELTKDIGFYNYDISNSHLFWLIELCKQVKVNYSSIKKYIDNKKYYLKLAKSKGISSKDFKKIVLKSCNLASSTLVCSTTKSSIVVKNKILLNLLKDIKKTARKVIDKIVDKNIFARKCKSRYYWFNACSLHLKSYYKKDGKIHPKKCCATALKGHELIKFKRKLLCFLIFGLEAKFIHSLIFWCNKKGIKVYSDEYDGLLTNKPIPKELVKNIAKKVGVSTPNLRLKPFLDVKEKLMYGLD